MQKDDKLQALIRAFVPGAALLMCAEGLLDSRATVLYAICAVPALGALLWMLLRRGLLRRGDLLLLLGFPLFAWISSLHAYGLTLRFFLSKFLCVWCLLTAVYCAALTDPDREKLAERFACFSVAGLSALQLTALVSASLSLLSDPPAHNMIWGCFLRGRLTALGNANYLGFSAAALLLLSVFGLLETPRGKRALYGTGAVLGWFSLGLSNCRTGILGVSLALGLLVFAALVRGSARRRLLPGILLGLLAAGTAVGLLLLPLPVYRLLLGLPARLLHHPVLAENLKVLELRRFTEHYATLSDRTLIWRRCLSEVFRTPRRALLGVSSVDWGVIPSVYPGHHEILSPHAHNELLEILHRFGLIGLGIWLALLALWCVRGLRLLLDAEQRLSLRFLAAAAAGILAMGFTEPLPYFPAGTTSLALPFFLICGIVMRERRREE